MYNNVNTSGRNLLLSAALVMFSGATFAAPCGDPPEVPEIVDGTAATMDELVANSDQVKSYIAEADSYLSCYEGYAKSDEYKALDKAAQKAEMATYKDVLNRRNAIGEDFNEQVKAYKAANPS